VHVWNYSTKFLTHFTGTTEKCMGKQILKLLTLDMLFDEKNIWHSLTFQVEKSLHYIINYAAMKHLKYSHNVKSQDKHP